jgi:hypothetical protein
MEEGDACQFVSSNGTTLTFGTDEFGRARLRLQEYDLGEANGIMIEAFLSRDQCQILQSNIAQVGGTIA